MKTHGVTHGMVSVAVMLDVPAMRGRSGVYAGLSPAEAAFHNHDTSRAIALHNHCTSSAIALHTMVPAELFIDRISYDTSDDLLR